MALHPTQLDLEEIAMNGPFGKNFRVSKRSQQVRVSELPSSLDEVLKEYEKFLGQKVGILEKHNKLRGVSFVLSPLEIDRFIQLLPIFEDQKEYTNNTGYFVTKLLANSYKDGVRDVTLNFVGIKPFCNLGDYFNGYSLIRDNKSLLGLNEDPLSLTIQGKVFSAFSEASYVHVVMDEDEGHSFYCASSFKVSVKRAGPFSFAAIRKAEVIVHDVNEPETLFQCGLGEYGDDIRPYNIQVKTPNLSLVKVFKDRISQIEKGELYFIDPQGNEERVA